MSSFVFPTLALRDPEITSTTPTPRFNHQALFLGLVIAFIPFLLLLIAFFIYRVAKRFHYENENDVFLPRSCGFSFSFFRRQHEDLETGARKHLISTRDISKPKLLFGTGPFAMNFTDSNSWGTFGDRDNAKMQFKTTENPFTVGDDDDNNDDYSQPSGMTANAMADNVSLSNVQADLTCSAANLQPKSRCASQALDVQSAERARQLYSIEESSEENENRQPTDEVKEDNECDDSSDTESQRSSSSEYETSVLIAEIDDLTNMFRELSSTYEEDYLAETETDSTDDSCSSDSSSILPLDTRRSSSPSMLSTESEVFDSPMSPHRGVLRASNNKYETREDAKVVLSERRIDMQRSPELRSVIPNPSVRDPCTSSRATAPIYTCHFLPRSESIEKLKKVLKKQFNMAEYYKPSVSSPLVSGSDLRPRLLKGFPRKSLLPYLMPSKTPDLCHESNGFPSDAAKKRSPEPLRAIVLRRMHNRASTIDTLLIAVPGNDPFSDAYASKSPLDDPDACRSGTSVPFTASQPTTEVARTTTTEMREPQAVSSRGTEYTPGSRCPRMNSLSSDLQSKMAATQVPQKDRASTSIVSGEQQTFLPEKACEDDLLPPYPLPITISKSLPREEHVGDAPDKETGCSARNTAGAGATPRRSSGKMAYGFRPPAPAEGHARRRASATIIIERPRDQNSNSAVPKRTTPSRHPISPRLPSSSTITTAGSSSSCCTRRSLSDISNKNSTGTRFPSLPRRPPSTTPSSKLLPFRPTRKWTSSSTMSENSDSLPHKRATISTPSPSRALPDSSNLVSSVSTPSRRLRSTPAARGVFRV